MASPPFSIAETVPADGDFVRLFPAAERTFRDIVESWLVLEHDATTGRHAFPTNTTAALGALTFATGSISYDTTLDVLRYKLAGGHKVVDFPSGTRMLFQQSTAPPGWTKESDAAFNDAAVQIVTGATGTGGSTAFSSVFAARTILQANLPNVSFTGTAASDGAHRHFVSSTADTVGAGGLSVSTTNSIADSWDNSSESDYDLVSDNATDATVGRTSSDGAHTHSVSVSSGGSGTALDFAVKFVGFIVAEKD